MITFNFINLLMIIFTLRIKQLNFSIMHNAEVAEGGSRLSINRLSVYRLSTFPTISISHNCQRQFSAHNRFVFCFTFTMSRFSLLLCPSSLDSVFCFNQFPTNLLKSFSIFPQFPTDLNNILMETSVKKRLQTE